MTDPYKCGRCGLPVSPGVCAPQSHVFHDRPEQCVPDLVAEVARLRDALDRYGEHDGDCAASVVGAPGDARCTCGYDDAVANGSPPLRPREG